MCVQLNGGSYFLNLTPLKRTTDRLVGVVPSVNGWREENHPGQRVGSCYLEVSFGTTGVDTWCYLECYMVLPAAGRCLALPGFPFWSSFFCVVPKYPRSPNSNFWKKINFHLEVLPVPTPVVVTCLPGPPSDSIAMAPKCRAALPSVSNDARTLVSEE